ncbi:MAG: 1-acyl-sn-glycerol-3-phosphate acyltransferase, partial [Solirubrobacteraceae bacterium]
MRARGANPIVYGIVRVSFQIFFLIYFRMQRIGLEHVPKRGPVIIAANHRSFLDPFVIACMARRPMYYVAKQEIFMGRVISWLLTSLGAFPVRRGASDSETIITAKAILERGDIVLIFPEGTRTRPGALGTPRRGVGRLALESGAPVVPVAVIGTESIRKGFLIRPHKVRIRAGRALRFPTVEQPSPALAGAVTDRIWPCVMLQWEWLGGLAPIRRIAVIGAGAWGTALAVLLARAGFEVELGCRTKEHAEALAATRVNDRHLPAVELPDQLRVRRASQLNLEGHDLVCLAVPATALPAVLAAHGGQITRRLGMLVAGSGLVTPFGTLPAAFAAARCNARAVAVLGGPARADGVLVHGGSVVVASQDRGFTRQLRDLLRAAQLDVTVSSDVVGVQLAAAATDAAAVAAEAGATAGPDIA